MSSKPQLKPSQYTLPQIISEVVNCYTCPEAEAKSHVQNAFYSGFLRPLITNSWIPRSEFNGGIINWETGEVKPKRGLNAYIQLYFDARGVSIWVASLSGSNDDNDDGEKSMQEASNTAPLLQKSQTPQVERETLLWIVGVCLHKFKPSGFQASDKGNSLAQHLIDYATKEKITPKVKGTLSKAILETREAVEILPRVEEIVEDAERVMSKAKKAAG